jgi:zinc finger SWIM domain-containing protein 3
MGLTLDRVTGEYEALDLILEHNHVLHLPRTFHLMTSQRKISEVQAFEIEATDNFRIRPKAAYELASRQVGGRMNLNYTCRDHKNYL